jgi:hypothetical protein
MASAISQNDLDDVAVRVEDPQLAIGAVAGVQDLSRMLSAAAHCRAHARAARAPSASAGSSARRPGRGCDARREIHTRASRP